MQYRQLLRIRRLSCYLYPAGYIACRSREPGRRIRSAANRHDMLSWSRPLSGFCPLRLDFKKAPTVAERWKDPGFIINKFYVGFMWVNSKLVGRTHKRQWPSGALSLNWQGRMQKLFARKPVRRCTIFSNDLCFRKSELPASSIYRLITVNHLLCKTKFIHSLK